MFAQSLITYAYSDLGQVCQGVEKISILLELAKKQAFSIICYCSDSPPSITMF